MRIPIPSLKSAVQGMSPRINKLRCPQPIMCNPNGLSKIKDQTRRNLFPFFPKTPLGPNPKDFQNQPKI